MAKARAIVKRRKAVRNIRKITKTMQMIATAKFQRPLVRATGTKPFTLCVREPARELAASVGDIEHPAASQARPEDDESDCADRAYQQPRIGRAYNGSVLRLSMHFIREQEAAGKTIDLYVAGKKGISFFRFQKRTVAQRMDAQDMPKYADVEKIATRFIDEFVAGKIGIQCMSPM